MRPRAIAPWCGVAVTAALAFDWLAEAQSRFDRSTRDGVYSAEQAERGRGAFEDECMDCHEMVEFTGADAYLESKNGATLWEILDFMWSEMPEDAPAWLEPEEYTDILAYILSAYGMPPGQSALTADQTLLERTRVDGPELPGG